MEQIDKDLQMLDGRCTQQHKDLKKLVVWQKKANNSLQGIIEHLEVLEDHNSYRQKEIDELQEKVYLLESQVGEPTPELFDCSDHGSPSRLS